MLAPTSSQRWRPRPAPRTGLPVSCSGLVRNAVHASQRLQQGLPQPWKAVGRCRVVGVRKPVVDLRRPGRRRQDPRMNRNRPYAGLVSRPFLRRCRGRGRPAGGRARRLPDPLWYRQSWNRQYQVSLGPGRRLGKAAVDVGPGRLAVVVPCAADAILSETPWKPGPRPASRTAQRCRAGQLPRPRPDLSGPPECRRSAMANLQAGQSRTG